MKRRDRRAASRSIPTTSSGSSARTPAALYEAGLHHLRLEQYLEAQLCCQQALAMDSSHPGIHNLMGLLSLQAEQFDHAVEWFAGAIRQDPKSEYLLSLGDWRLRHLGRREEALKVIDKAVQLKPTDADLWKGMGDVLVELDRPAEALLSYQQALKLNQNHWGAANECGRLLHRLRRFLEEALSYFHLCDLLLPNHAPTLHDAHRLSARPQRRFEGGLDRHEARAKTLDPTNPDLWNNVGAILQSAWPR